MKIISILLLLFLLLIPEINAISINELIPNPFGNDNNQEYIEIYGSNNLSGFIIGDSSSNDSLTLLHFCDSCNYSLIVEDGFNYSEINCSIYSAGATIGNALDNTQDDIYIYYNNSIVDYVSYFSVIEGQAYSFFDDGWIYTNVSPCYENFIYIPINNNTNQTNNLTNVTKLCNVSISLEIKDNFSFFNSGEAIKFYNKLSDDTYDYIITYWIDDYFNSTLKTPVETTNLNQKQWTPNFDSKYEVARLKNNLTFINCSNINNKTYSEEVIFIVGDSNQQSFSEKSYVNFDEAKISSNYVTVSGEIYKGDTTKTLFSFHFQCKNKNKRIKKSSELKLYFSKKFSTQKFSYKLPIKDQLEICYYDPEISYSGLGLEGDMEVENFLRKEFEEVENIPPDENNENKESNLVNTNLSNKAFEIFSYSKNNYSLKLNSNFVTISQELFSNKTDDVFKDNISQSLSGYATNEIIIDDGFSFINIIVVALLIAVIGIILFKKW